jgi:exo-beta-1,3-glucanase (GH17 family)
LTNEGFVDIAVVGNEVLYRKELNEEVIITLIK